MPGDSGHIGLIVPNRIVANSTMIALICGVLFSTGCESKPTISLELQQLRDRYEQVQDDMTEMEVIDIFEGYPSGAAKNPREWHPATGKPLKRPSTFSRMFVEKSGAVEGDHFVDVYFDEAGYVVGKRFGEFSR
jgi:hypothetical protein